MAHFTKKNLKQKAVYWANPVPDGYGGSTFDSPAEIDCRWEDSNELFLNDKGENVPSNSKVFVNQDMTVGEYLFLGELTELDSHQDPERQNGAYRIKSFQKTPGLRAKQYIRKAIL
jgi:hypothetical protein